MIVEAKERLTDVAASVVGDMSRRDPFHALAMGVVVALLGWFVWQDHSLKADLVNMQLTEQKLMSDRIAQVTKFTGLIESLNQDNSNARDLFVKMMGESETRGSAQFDQADSWITELKNDIANRSDTINEKLDLIIQNQHIRGAKRRQEQQ